MKALLTDFPRGVDNVMRTAWDACERKFLLAHIFNLRSTDPSIHLVAGGAYAKGLETMRREFFSGNTDRTSYLGKALIAAIREWDKRLNDPLEDSAKSLTNVLCALVYYLEQFPLEHEILVPLRNQDGPFVEFTFALPLSGETHPQTGDPVLYCGRFDQFVDYGGAPAPFDDKTASQLGGSWVSGWALDSQLTGYIWAARQYGIRSSSAFVRGVSFLKRGFGNADAIEHRTDYEIEQWHRTASRNLSDMKQRYVEWADGDFKNPFEVFAPSLGQACKAYGGCPYLDLCRKGNWEQWIEPKYHVYIWDPLAATD